MCIKKFLKTQQWIINLKFKKRPFLIIDKFRLNNIIENGGWHFCNLKSEEQLHYKYNNLCETNDPYHFKEKIDPKYLQIDEIQKRLYFGEDMIGRNEVYKANKIDKFFPKYILNNLEKYKNWIAK
jgi:beta-1,4-mannosyl-glycoprotein beta-1,4-N-acetylglucosaminyltransferase